MPFLLMYWKHIALVALLIVVGWRLYDMGGTSAKLDCAQAQIEANEAAAEALRIAQQEAFEANEALRKELAKPRPSVTIRGATRANPSTCTVHPDVADGVRQAVAEANRRAAAK